MFLSGKKPASSLNVALIGKKNKIEIADNKWPAVHYICKYKMKLLEPAA